jgi:hypothetical protein
LHYRGKLQTVIEDMDLPNPVIRSHYGNGFVKQYVRDHLLLRTEPASNNVNDYSCKKAIENLPRLRENMSTVIDNYHNVQQDILETFLNRGQLRQLAQPTILPNGRRIPGLKLDHPRQLALMHALVRFCHIAAQNTFTTAEIYTDTLATLEASPSPPDCCSPWQATANCRRKNTPNSISSISASLTIQANLWMPLA